jgi:hypothetical protein
MSTEGMTRMGAAPVGALENGDGTSGDRRVFSTDYEFPVGEPARDAALETARR